MCDQKFVISVNCNFLPINAERDYYDHSGRTTNHQICCIFIKIVSNRCLIVISGILRNLIVVSYINYAN